MTATLSWLALVAAQLALAAHVVIVGNHFADQSLLGYGAARFGAAALLALAWLVSRGELKSAFSGKALLLGLVAGTIGLTGARAILLTVQGQAGALTALAAPLAPLVLALALHLARTETLNLWISGALVIGLAGVIVGTDVLPSFGALSEPAWAMIFAAGIVAITALYAFGKPLVATNGVMGGLALTFLAAAGAAVALSPDAAFGVLGSVTASFDAFFWFMADVLLTTLIGYGLLYFAMKSLPAVSVAASLFLAPIAFVAWHSWDGALGFRTPDVMQIAGGIMTLAACTILASRQS